MTIISLTFSIGACFSQSVSFKQDLSWEEVLKLARSNNKYIFVDCYATWCVPCTTMDKTVFSNDTVGSFINAKFINVKIQFDSTSRDIISVRRMYSTARYFEKEYGINVYPTYLFFDSEGHLVSKEIGSSNSVDEFMEKVRAAINPNEQYYTLRSRFLSGERDKGLIKKVAVDAVRLKDMKTAYLVHNDFVDLVDSLFDKDMLFVMCSSISSVNSKGFKLLLERTQMINDILNDDGRAQAIIKWCMRDTIEKLCVQNPDYRKDWKSIYKRLNEFAPAYANEVLMLIKIEEARQAENWEQFAKLKMDYYDNYWSKFDHNSRFIMNNELMEIFVKCFNRRTLKRAADWSKITIHRDGIIESPPCMDTYANLLYKAGLTDAAIHAQERAVRVLVEQNPKSDPTVFIENLNKMKSGLPTW